MKHFLRIVVTIVVLVAIGFGVYFIWFRPDDDLSTFLKLSNLSDFKKSDLNYEQSFSDLVSADGHGTVSIKQVTTKYKFKETNGVEHEEIISTEEKVDVYEFAFAFDKDNSSAVSNYYGSIYGQANYDKILAYRDILLKDRNGYENAEEVYLDSDFNLIEGTEQGNATFKYYSYSVLEKYLDEVYSQYLAYTQVAENVTSKAQKQINEAIENYKSALKTLNNDLNSILNYQKAYVYTVDSGVSEKNISGNSVDLGDGVRSKTVTYIPNYISNNNAAQVELENRYQKAILSYRSMLKEYAELIQQIKNFVIDFVFDGKILNEVSTIKYDMLLLSIKNAVSLDYDYSKTEQIKNGSQMLADCGYFVSATKDPNFNENARNLLSAYNNIYKNYSEGLSKVISLTSTQKFEFANNPSTQPEIKAEYASDLASILKLFGYK